MFSNWDLNRVVLRALGLCVMVVPLLAFADPAPSSNDWKTTLEPFRAQMQVLVDAKKIPDLQVSFARDKQLVWSEVFHGEPKIPCDTETRFRIASISKCITGTLLLKLVEEGKMNLDQPVTIYFPNNVPDADHMTLRLLAGHLAGIRHYQGNEMVNYQRHYAHLQDGLGLFDKSPLLWPPGTKFFYSSYGFNLLACAMEAVTHEDFPALVQEQILGPLHMTHTEVDDLTKLLPPTVTTYIRNSDGSVEHVKPSDDSYKWPSGGYLSTTEDLIKLGDAYLDPGFLSPASLQLVETEQATTSGKKVPYSIGWFVTHEKDGTVVIYHTGEAVGGEGLLLVNPKTRSVFAALWNVSRSEIGNDISGIAHALAAEK
jgi:serine beta-lactamase-like protein LACTB